MSWVRLDDMFAQHPKVIGLSDAAFRLHVTAMCYSALNLTDGHVPTGFTKPVRAAELVEAGLWDVVDGGWAVHDYLDYNPSRERVTHERTLASQRQSRFRNGVTTDVTNAAPLPLPHPLPQREEEKRSSPESPTQIRTRKRNHGDVEQVIRRS